MGVIGKNGYIGQPGLTATTLYTCPANHWARIIACTATNDTTTSTSVTFHKVPSGGTAGPTNIILNDKVLDDSETYLCPEVVGKNLDPGDFISSLAGHVTQVTVDLDVIEFPLR